MKSGFLKSKELLETAVAEGLYHNLVLQLKKDFKLANIPIALPESEVTGIITPEELITTLHEKIYFLLMEGFTDYLNLLYVVDVPEKVVKNIEVTDAVEVAEEISLRILERDWQKVVLKKKYNSSS